MPTPEDLSQADIDEMAASFREAMKPHEPEACPATGALNVNGEVIAVVPCMLPAGHDESRLIYCDEYGKPVDYYDSSIGSFPVRVEGTAHAWGIEWTDPPRRLVAVVVDEDDSPA